MDELIGKVAAEIEDSESDGDSYEATAKRIVAIPEIKEALEIRAIAEAGKISGIEFR
jgi:hypothetical protein